MSNKVLIADKMSLKAKEILKNNKIEVNYKENGTPADELINIIGDYQGLIIRSASKVTKEIIDKATNLKLIGRAGVGVDNVDLKAATEKKIYVMNTPLGNTVSTAEHTFALISSLSRKVSPANVSTHQGKWEKPKFKGSELFEKTLGIIGFGNVGKIVTRIAHGYRMKVIVSSKSLDENKAREANVEKVSLDSLLGNSDIVTVHLKGSPDNKNLINLEMLQKMKKTAFVVNCARGDMVNENDLKRALEDGTIAGAALDVYEAEPLKNSPLFGLENVILTPHIAASTKEAQERVAIQIAEQMVDYFVTNKKINFLNTI